ARTRETIAGTPAFMAPEQTESGPISAAADQFSFCVALSWALHGRHPFDSSPGGPPLPTGRIPGSIGKALKRGLSKDPAAGFPSMDALLAVLASAARRRTRIAVLGTATLLAIAGLVLAKKQFDDQRALEVAWTCDARGPGQILKPSPTDAAPTCFSRFETPL